MQKAVYIVTRFLSIAFLLCCVYHILYPIEPLEYRLIEQGVTNWLLAPVMIRLLVVFISFCAALLLFNINAKRIATYSLGTLSILFTLDIACSFCCDTVTSKSISAPFGFLWLGLIGLAILVLTLFLSIRTYDKENSVKFKWLKIAAIILVLPWAFILNPVYPSDLKEITTELNETFNTDTLSVEGFDKEQFLQETSKDRLLVAFYSTGCPHCMLAATKIEIAQKVNQNFPDCYVVFLGTDEGVQFFSNKANASFNYTLLNDDAFFELGGYSMPNFCYLENGVIKRRWDGRTFNYGVINDLSK